MEERSPAGYLVLNLNCSECTRLWRAYAKPPMSTCARFKGADGGDLPRPPGAGTSPDVRRTGHYQAARSTRPPNPSHWVSDARRRAVERRYLRRADIYGYGAMVQLVVRQAAKLVGTGIVLGFIAAAIVSRTIATLLYGITPVDIATLASVTTVLAIVASLAVYLPARRAAEADPMESLGTSEFVRSRHHRKTARRETAQHGGCFPRANGNRRYRSAQLRDWCLTVMMG